MYCISISHKTTPAQIREVFAFSKEGQIAFEQLVCQKREIHGCVILSTCNRCEIYFTGEKSALSLMEKAVVTFKGLEKDILKKYYRVYDEDTSMMHLFKVCSGMESMVLGEVEILRQVKEAYQIALEHKCTDAELNIIFQNAQKNAKDILTKTKVTRLPLSIGTLAGRRAMDFCEKRQSFHILIVGVRGKIGRIIANDILDMEHAQVKVYGTTRMKHHAKRDFSKDSRIQLVDYAARYDYLEWADVIVSATQSPHYTFTKDLVDITLKDKKTEKLFIDVAVPMDIDGEIGDISGMKLIGIDDFERMAKENNKARETELHNAEYILQESVDETYNTLLLQRFSEKKPAYREMLGQKKVLDLLYQMKKESDHEVFRTVLMEIEKLF